MKYGPYSSSRLDSATCGYLFYNTYVNPKKERGKVRTLPQDRGSAVHDILEYMTNQYKHDINYRFFTVPSDNKLDRPTPTKEMTTVIQNAVNKYPASFQQLDVLENCALRYARRRPDNIDSDTGVELMLAVKDEGGELVQAEFDDPKAIMRGKIDLLFFSDDAKGAKIIDHKTQMNIEEADTFQMGVYAWLTSKCHPWLEHIESSLYFAQYGVYSNPVIWTKEDLARMEDEILSKIDIVEARDNWDPCPNYHCQYCDLVGECPALKGMVDVHPETGFIKVKEDNVEVLGDTAKAIILGQRIKVLETYVTQAKKNLKEHVKNFGPISLPGLVYEFRDKEDLDWAKATKKRHELKAILEKHSIDPVEYMGFSSTVSKGLALIENDLAKKEFFEAVPRKVSTTFRGYKM